MCPRKVRAESTMRVIESPCISEITLEDAPLQIQQAFAEKVATPAGGQS